jgi:hypothetical protein
VPPKRYVLWHPPKSYDASLTNAEAARTTSLATLAAVKNVFFAPRTGPQTQSPKSYVPMGSPEKLRCPSAGKNRQYQTRSGLSALTILIAGYREPAGIQDGVPQKVTLTPHYVLLRPQGVT